MNSDPSIFSQLISFAPRYEFTRCVRRYAGNLEPRKFSYWDQFLTMVFAQLTLRESLRDIEVCLSALGSKTYNMGFRSRVTRSTLADANDQRDCRIWSDFAYVLIAEARKLYVKEVLEIEFGNAMYAIDSTTISLCLSLCPWARFRSGKGAIKLHTQLDLRGNIPSFILISQGKMNDVNFLDDLILEAGAMYVMDRGYFDFTRLFCFSSNGAFFVTRLKKNISYRRREIFYRDKHTPVRCDAMITPLSRKARKHYPLPLRLVEYFDAENNKELAFITNNLVLSAQSIADIYRARWQVELFFKWIKQHLRIKTFFGTSQNAVTTQIWIAVSVYLLLAIAKKKLNLDHSLYTMMQVFSISSGEKMPILQAFSHPLDQELIDGQRNQLNLFDIPTGH
jgi:Transposase DDE domain/Domain of unknown function (DUF4372)